MTPDHTTSESVPVTLARLEGKVDAALAVQSARVDEHARRLDVVDGRLNAHSADLSAHGKALAAVPAAAPRMAGWQVAGIVITAVVGLGSVLGLLITLMRIIPDVT